ncbi:response regulator [Desulfobaculum bizertense]|uniref:Response regulator containing CheY-like receiver, AAA-type ATPase, and DNA-binding domains n=1 Tax=Desulfobaculum bizertense DSM 18034 TaxID=1121442 RepID=A0A1T4VY50_9BACT|nr:response regulator [Desulfobaculum bizertense]UIJ36952.1 response regulator [Desulfobaculum bizertense]SKA69755.1 Response regulator containing CheY-like receiver, AAA-type ATPase, and DNA-binding domains [Desulfobaculum bizertense DSM 18034]
MAIIDIFNASYVRAEEVSARVASELGLAVVRDEELLSKASERYGIAESRLHKTMFGKTSVFNSFTHERERNVACLRAIVAEELSRDDLMLFGWGGLLAPRSISHMLRVLLVADMGFRVSHAVGTENVSAEEAGKLVAQEDENLLAWSQFVAGRPPFDEALYDLVAPMGSRSVDDIAGLVIENARRGVLVQTAQSVQAVKDFKLQAQVALSLAQAGHIVGVEASQGVVTLTINKNVIMLSRLEDELKRLTVAVDGVQEVVTRVGKDFYQADIYRRADFSLPNKVLLVDDEREFVETLSERLTMRDIGSAVVYDGPQALNLMEEEEPEVMILDLKMPGMDGIEVLRRVRRNHPNVAVIILTGHGSEKDRETCMELGAFAYLQKPVDIDSLSATVKNAYEKVNAS